MLLLYVFADLAIFPAKEEQRISLPHYDILDFGNKNRVIPGRLGRVQSALKIGERSVQNRRAMLGPVKTRTGFGFGTLMRAFRTSIIFGNRALILT